MKTCAWCDGPMETDNTRNVCRVCLPNPDLRHECVKGLGHLVTLGADYCAECYWIEEARKQRQEQNAPLMTALQATRSKHAAELSVPWPGCEFGKAIIGRALDHAISDLQ